MPVSIAPAIRRPTTPLRLALHAMACRFEVVLHGDDEVRLRAAGEEALAEVRRLEAKLNLYRPGSDLSRLNAAAAQAPVPVDRELFGLLRHAKALHAQTHGAFDPTVAPLLNAWGFIGGGGRLPSARAVAAARARTGFDLVYLDPDQQTVRYQRRGVQLDLGGIGKGYALDVAATVLQDVGVRHAFLHGGTSTCVALGHQPDGTPWTVAVPDPSEGKPMLAAIPLEDEALAVSAVWGKAFEHEGAVYGHVLDPRLGRPVTGAVLAAVALPSATDADALSTGLLVLGRQAAHLLRRLPDARGLVACSAGGDALDVVSVDLASTDLKTSSS